MGVWVYGFIGWMEFGALWSLGVCELLAGRFINLNPKFKTQILPRKSQLQNPKKPNQKVF